MTGTKEAMKSNKRVAAMLDEQKGESVL